jgi:hypothetical protein
MATVDIEYFIKYKQTNDYLREVYPNEFKAINHLLIHSRVQPTKIIKLRDMEINMMKELFEVVPNITDIAQTMRPNSEVEKVIFKYAHYY